MYKITCDGFPILDTNDDTLIVLNPKLDLEVNTVGATSFTIFKNHPHYDKLQKLKSLIEISDEYGVLFRGRITGDSKDFYNRFAVDVEGAMAFFNDSIIRPFAFPDDFEEDADYIAAKESGNVVEFFLNWLINQHNTQVQPFQRLKIGNVTVSDPNNNIERSDTAYKKTWQILKEKLFESTLGGKLCARYESDGTYIDYLARFTETNEQRIVYRENLLDLRHDTDASEIYTAAIPLGAEIEVTESTGNDYEGTYGTIISETTVTKRIDLSEVEDGDIGDDIVKSGDTIYSKSGVAAHGWIYAPVESTTWEDVTEPANLLSKSVEWMENIALLQSETVELSAVDLHYSDSAIRSFRIYKNVNAVSEVHGLSNTLELTKLSIDLLNPQNTKITVGETKLTLTGSDEKTKKDLSSIITNYVNEQITKEAERTNELFKKTEVVIDESGDRFMASVTGIQDAANKVAVFEEALEQTKTDITSLQLYDGSLNMRVAALTGNITDLESSLEQTAESIEAKVSQQGGDTSFSWELLADHFALSSNGEEVFKVDETGAEIRGKVESDYGKVGLCEFSSPRTIVIGTDLEKCPTLSERASIHMTADYKLKWLIRLNPDDEYSVKEIPYHTYVKGDGSLSYAAWESVRASYEYGISDSENTIPGEWLDGAYHEIDTNALLYEPYLWVRASVWELTGGSSSSASIDCGFLYYRLGDFSSYAAIFHFDGGLKFTSDSILNGQNRMQIGEDEAVLSGTWKGTSGQVIASWRGAKHDIETLDDRYSVLFDALSPKRYKYNDGNSDRYHTGLILDELKNAMDKANIEPSELAAYCVSDELTGEGGIRYDELISLCIDQIQKLKKRIAVLEEPQAKSLPEKGNVNDG